MNILFEKDLFPEEEEVWKAHGASTHEYFFDDRKLNKFTPTVVRGSIQFNNSVGSAFRQKGWPDLRWPFNNDWFKYGYLFLANFPDLLNEDVYFGGQGHYTAEVLLDSAKDYTWPLWIRSESGSKGLAGGLMTVSQLETWVQFLKQERNESMKIVTASAKTIIEEYRLIFVGGKFISGSQYFADGRVPGDDFVPKKLLTFGIEWAKKYGHNWAGGFVLDVADTPEGCKVVEVNNLLTAGWYSADTGAIVEAIMKQIKEI